MWSNAYDEDVTFMQMQGDVIRCKLDVWQSSITNAGLGSLKFVLVIYIFWADVLYGLFSVPVESEVLVGNCTCLDAWT